jgi:hypothetical protein
MSIWVVKRFDKPFGRLTVLTKAKDSRSGTVAGLTTMSQGSGFG